ncbi:kinase-like domain-containing protein [Flammula alnicola]|nr:kinase-like domain-containing protein [Flammula alnicola]
MAMATPIRKKRNFKALQLAVSDGTRCSAPVERKKRPPPMIIKAPKIPNSSGAVLHGASTAPHSASTAVRRNTYHATLSTTLANLDMNAEIKFDLKNEDLKDLQELGQGNGGSVKKVEHIPTKTIMAKKIVLIDAKPSVRKQILRELQIMHDCHSNLPRRSQHLHLHGILDKGSLDGIYKKIGPIDIDVVGQVALAVLEGLTYLYDVHRIIHRDIKPSNILFNSRGEIKICDFGVSGELINSIADTFVGTSTYMSPERIQGAQYTVKSDVWSLGISLIELALGRFPFSESTSDDSDSDYEGTLSPARPGSISLSGLPPARIKRNTPKKDKRKSKGVSLQGGGMTMSILELLQHIVNEPAPRLTPEGRFPKEAEIFIDSCLLKDPESRKTPKDLLNDAWIEQARTSTVNLEEWASTF